MRTAVSAVLLILLLAPAMLKIGILAWYEANINFVASQLCENRKRPERHCNGKCYLSKQLAKADGADHSARHRLADVSKLELPPFVLPELLHLQRYMPEEPTRRVAYQSPFAEEVTLRIFHPPG